MSNRRLWVPGTRDRCEATTSQRASIQRISCWLAGLPWWGETACAANEHAGMLPEIGSFVKLPNQGRGGDFKRRKVANP
ncbi:MAG: hypothetical protein KatS3mg057_0417 [Herpetosiphonaceae bacterium]|nr:MAG: hypothetical protein KatS3mg057_0417 [Herpetosiphonaceae bacterium]